MGEQLQDPDSAQHLLHCRDPWVLPTEAGARRAAAAAKARLAAAAGGASDHLTLAAAFRGWVAARQVRNRTA
jgi:hypothetical protein